MNKELLIETRQFTPKPVRLIEGMGNGGNVFVEGILATVEVKNGHGRYYKKELWDREIENFQNKIKQKSTETVGELDHPDSQVINLKNASHAVRDLWWVGDEIHGKVEIFCDMGDKGTTSGRIALAMDMTENNCLCENTIYGIMASIFLFEAHYNVFLKYINGHATANVNQPTQFRAIQAYDHTNQTDKYKVNLGHSSCG